MALDRFVLAARQMIGCARSAVGRIIGAAGPQADGKATPSNDKVQNAAGSAKDRLKH